jgi:hypothetical protein
MHSRGNNRVVVGGLETVKVGVVDAIDFFLAVPERILGTR